MRDGIIYQNLSEYQRTRYPQCDFGIRGHQEGILGVTLHTWSGDVGNSFWVGMMNIVISPRSWASRCSVRIWASAQSPARESNLPLALTKSGAAPFLARPGLNKEREATPAGVSRSEISERRGGAGSRRAPSPSEDADKSLTTNYIQCSHVQSVERRALGRRQ